MARTPPTPPVAPEGPPAPGKKHHGIIYPLKYLLLVLLVVYLVGSGRLEFSRIWSFFTFANLPWLGFICGVFLANVFTGAFRQRLLINYLGGELTLADSVRILLAGLFFNNFLPGGTMGDVLRIYYIKQRSRISSYQQIAGVIVLDRVLGLGSLVILGLVSAFTISRLAWSESSHWMMTRGLDYLLLGSLAPVSVLVFLFLLRFEPALSLLKGLMNKFPILKRVKPLLDSLVLFSKKRRVVLQALGLALCGHFLAVCGITVLAYCMYGPSVVLASLFASPFAWIVSAIPVTPGNIGWTETVADTIWSLCNAQGGATVFTLWRAFKVIVSLAGAGAYLGMGKPRDMPGE